MGHLLHGRPLHREQAWLDFRLDGEPGDAILDIVQA